MNRLNYYIPGAVIVLIGLLIVVFPQILVALVAALIISIGVGALFIGHQMRKTERAVQTGYDRSECDDDGFCRVWSRHYPVFHRWTRRF